MVGKRRVRTAKPRKSRAKGSKRGNQGGFKGARLQLLNDQLPAYLKARAQKSLSAFFREFCNGYWEAFPWWIEKDVEPTPEMMVFNEEMTPEVSKRKQEVMVSTTKVGALHLFSSPF